MSTALSKQQASDLRACEQIINNGMMTFRKVGQALCKIRDDRLYKSSHKSFEAYCNERWNFGRSYAARLIEAADVPEVLPNGDTIESEGAARKYLDAQKHHPVADDSDDDQADGDTGRVSSVPLPDDSDSVGVSSGELNRIGWWLEKLAEDWDEYTTHYGDNADWMHARIAIEQFAISKGED